MGGTECILCRRTKYFCAIKDSVCSICQVRVSRYSQNENQHFWCAPPFFLLAKCHLKQSLNLSWVKITCSAVRGFQGNNNSFEIIICWWFDQSILTFPLNIWHLNWELWCLAITGYTLVKNLTTQILHLLLRDAQNLPLGSSPWTCLLEALWKAVVVSRKCTKGKS